MTRDLGARRWRLGTLLLLFGLACNGENAPTGPNDSGPDPLAVTTTSLPDADRGAAYDTPLAATGGEGAYSWSIVDGALPEGLSLDAGTGVVSGTPTLASGTFTVRVASTGGQTAQQALSIDVLPLLPSDLIVFDTDRDSNREIYVIRPDRTGLANISMNAADDRDPAWSPDRTRIAFVSDRDGDDEIYTMSAAGADVARLTTQSGSDRRPAYSPDGTKIAFDGDGDGDEEIYVMDADGTGGPTQLTFNTIRWDQDAAWAPASDRILFTTYRDGDDNLYVMNVDGTAQTLLVDTGPHDWEPDWSPDGTRIVFTVQDASGDDIWVVNADGTTGLAQLTFDGASDTGATWSPDGSWIAFTSDRNGNDDIYVMTPDGANLIQVTTSSADDSRPSWVH